MSEFAGILNALRLVNSFDTANDQAKILVTMMTMLLSDLFSYAIESVRDGCQAMSWTDR